VGEHEGASAAPRERAGMGGAHARARVAALILDCRPVALQMARSLCGERPADAEDLVQATFQRVLEDVDRLAHLKKNEFQGWLYTVMYHLFITLCRKRETERTAIGALAYESLGIAGSPEERYLIPWAGFSAERFREALEALEPKQRRCLQLQMDGLKHREIAERLKEKMGSVGYWIAEAKRHLREYFLGDGREKP
jgi:RNA polymerase sigma-19 factor, ECF subfamily